MINRDNIIKACESEMGVFEYPAKSNGTKYGEWYGMNNVHWCAIFVAYCFYKAGYILYIDKWKKEIGGFHYVPTLLGKAQFKKMFTNTPQAGDIVLMDFAPNDGKVFSQHVGIYSGNMDQKGRYLVYEGNTSSGAKGSQNNGDGTFLKARQKEFIIGFVSLDKMLEHGYLIKRK